MTGSKVGERGGHGRERSSGRDLNTGCPKRNAAAYVTVFHRNLAERRNSRHSALSSELSVDLI